ncbi:MAG: MFS transporter [Anaerolineae bacterium]|nr:MFS transporter [Anaerolineae bacterium]
MARTTAPAAMPPHYRRNALLLISDFVFFVIGTSFVNSQTVLPDFIGRLTDSEVLVGLSSVIFSLGVLLPQLFLAPAVARAKSKSFWVLAPGLPARAMTFVVAAGILIFGAQNPTPVILIVFIGYGAFAVGDGISALGWMDLIGTTIPNERRGRMFGVGRVIYSLLVLFIVTDLVRYILDPATGPDFPNDYALLFFLCGVCLMASIVSFFFIREPAPTPRADEGAAGTGGAHGWRAYLDYLRTILRQDRHFRRYLIMRVLCDAAMIASPFFIRFTTERLGIANEIAVSGGLQMTMLGGIIGGPLAGWLGDRYGSRWVMVLGCACIAAQPALMLAASAETVWMVYLVFALSGVINATFEPGFLNWLVEYGGDQRPIFFSLSSTFKIAGVLIAGSGGFIVEQVSFEGLFIGALALALVVLWLAWRTVEPRSLLRDDATNATNDIVGELADIITN